MGDELFFVGIRDPIEIRKDLLTSSKNLIDALKRHARYKGLKDVKTENIMNLKRVFDELLVLNKKLRNKMPRTSFKAPKESKPKEKAVPKAHVDVLEQELSKIEQRLGSLE